ncbi:MAG: hypothetical protein AB8F78_15000 [Saprospiraceae bacterium]
MNRYSPLVISLLFTLLILACGGKDSAEGQDNVIEESASAKTPEPENGALPRIPNELMQALVDSADYVDYLFYEMDFSMSMDNKQGVMYALAKIGEAPAPINASCKPIGRIFYQIKGRNAAEADLYFSAGCTYLVFMKDNAPIYANSMSEVGKKFLNNQFGAIMKNYVPIE